MRRRRVRRINQAQSGTADAKLNLIAMKQRHCFCYALIVD